MSSHFKLIKIKEAIKNEDVPELRRLGRYGTNYSKSQTQNRDKNIHKYTAKKHGFIFNRFRKQAWPLLLGLDDNANHIEKEDSASLVLPLSTTTEIDALSDELPDCSTTLMCNYSSNVSTCSNKSNHDQIEKDISRSALNFYNTKLPPSECQANLGQILHSMFDDTFSMHYIQGFNDVASVFYAVTNDQELSKKLSDKVAKTLLKDYIMAGSEELNFAALSLIFKIINYHDIELNNLFQQIESAHCLSFAVSWILTMFAHEIKQISVIARVYDYCLAAFESNELVSIYLSAALLLWFKKDLLHNVKGDALQDLHVFFAEIKWEKINFDKIINISEELFEKYPPSMISPIEDMIVSNYDYEENEIKENALMNDADSSSEYNSDFTFISPMVDPNEDLANFDIDFDNDSNDKKEDTKKKMMENNDRYKPKAVATKKKVKNSSKSSSKNNIFDAIPDYFDEFVSLFDKKHKKKRRQTMEK